MTLDQYLRQLEEEYGATKRPSRYFKVKDKSSITASEKKGVKKRFLEFLVREICVALDKENPDCYARVDTDIKTNRRKRRSSYTQAYYDWVSKKYSSEEIDGLESLAEFISKKKGQKLGLWKIAMFTDLPYYALKEVYDKGVGAYATSGSRVGMTADQWGYGRVYSFLNAYLYPDASIKKKRYYTSKVDRDIAERIGLF